MKTDEYGLIYYTEEELFKSLYTTPDIDLNGFCVLDPEQFNKSADSLYSQGPRLSKIEKPTINVDEFDKQNQENWHMPDEYKQLDIAKVILDSCKDEQELQRCGEELLMYSDRNLMDLLRFLKYLVDTISSNNIVMGVGRGSSVASFVLYKLGIHKVNSMYYDLDVNEFLR
jgi:DNA polymerase III alpha subunit